MPDPEKEVNELLTRERSKTTRLLEKEGRGSGVVSACIGVMIEIRR